MRRANESSLISTGITIGMFLITIGMGIMVAFVFIGLPIKVMLSMAFSLSWWIQVALWPSLGILAYKYRVALRNKLKAWWFVEKEQTKTACVKPVPKLKRLSKKEIDSFNKTGVKIVSPGDLK